MELPFAKYEANGNALVLSDLRSRYVRDLSGLAVALCEPHTGVGGDGLLVLQRGADDIPLMRMFNPDGTEDFCGNGLLCTVKHLHDQGESRAGMVTLRSKCGLHEGKVRPVGRDRVSVTAEVLKPSFQPAGIPVRLPDKRIIDKPFEVGGKTFPISCVNVGTAHAVIFSEQDVPEGVFREISPLIEHHPVFPERTSILWCRVEGRNRIWMRIWERGVGETFACGTGACAALAVAASTGRTLRRATVASRGGKARVDWPAGRAIRLTAPTRNIYTGTYLPS